jgi:hypothetical protein
MELLPQVGPLNSRACNGGMLIDDDLVTGENSLRFSAVQNDANGTKCGGRHVRYDAALGGSAEVTRHS